MTDISSIKVVNIGDTGVGKTCVLVSYTEDQFPEEHVPTAFDNYSTMVKHGEKTITLQLWDTSGEQNDPMRLMSFKNCNVFIIYFDVSDKESLKHVRDTWVKELVNNSFEHVPRILVGNKIDLRKVKDNCVTKEEAEEMKNEVMADAYIECTAKDQIGLAEIFQTAVKVVLNPSKKPSKGKKNSKQGCKNQ